MARKAESYPGAASALSRMETDRRTHTAEGKTAGAGKVIYGRRQIHRQRAISARRATAEGYGAAISGRAGGPLARRARTFGSDKPRRAGGAPVAGGSAAGTTACSAAGSA